MEFLFLLNSRNFLAPQNGGAVSADLPGVESPES
jgi:hypothetical protein